MESKDERMPLVCYVCFWVGHRDDKSAYLDYTHFRKLTRAEAVDQAARMIAEVFDESGEENTRYCAVMADLMKFQLDEKMVCTQIHVREVEETLTIMPVREADWQ